MGRRKIWHLFGSVLVALCFSLVFVVCVTCETVNHNRAILVAYYAISASLFNVGWACVQVSHMSLVPDLARRFHDTQMSFPHAHILEFMHTLQWAVLES